jgi:hypothetical protein
LEVKFHAHMLSLQMKNVQTMAESVTAVQSLARCADVSVDLVGMGLH